MTRRVPAATLIALLMLIAVAIIGIGGCAQAEKTRYVRHLTTVVEPSADVPEEVVFTFDIDRKRVRDAVAVGGEH